MEVNLEWKSAVEVCSGSQFRIEVEDPSGPPYVHVHCDAGPNTTARATIANTPFTIHELRLQTRRLLLLQTRPFTTVRGGQLPVYV